MRFLLALLIGLVGCGRVVAQPGVQPQKLPSPFDLGQYPAGCGPNDSINGLRGSDTHWVSVLPSPPLPVIIEGTVRESFPNYYDNPYDHASHDQNLYVQLDPEYVGLHSRANATESIHGQTATLMEVEWETGHFPHEFWPMIGDRIWAAGRYIWDCGHKYQLAGGAEFKTEIHPPEAVASTRFAPSPFHDDPVTHPSLTNKTYFYASGYGGYYPSVGHSLDLVGRRYEFDIPLPPRPSARATPKIEVQDAPRLGSLSFTSAPTPAGQPDRIRVSITLAAPGPAGNYGRVFVAGWREDVPTVSFCRTKAIVDEIEIHDPHTTVAVGKDDYRVTVDTDGPTPWQMWGRVGTDGWNSCGPRMLRARRRSIRAGP